MTLGGGPLAIGTGGGGEKPGGPMFAGKGVAPAPAMLGAKGGPPGGIMPGGGKFGKPGGGLRRTLLALSAGATSTETRTQQGSPELQGREEGRELDHLLEVGMVACQPRMEVVKVLVSGEQRMSQEQQ